MGITSVYLSEKALLMANSLFSITGLMYLLAYSAKEGILKIIGNLDLANYVL